MSLFVCSSCDTVENTSCVNRTEFKRGENSNWNMHLMDMQGYSDKDIVKFKNGYSQTKFKHSVLMLCHKCNTGSWHDEWEQTKATPEELKLSKYSRYRYITPGTHEDGAMLGSYHEGYRLNPKYESIHNAFRDAVLKKGIEIPKSTRLEDNEYITAFSIIYKIFKEDEDNFDSMSVVDRTGRDWVDLYQLYLFVSDCLVDSFNSKSITYNTLKLYATKNTRVLKLEENEEMLSIINLTNNPQKLMEHYSVRVNVPKERYSGQSNSDKKFSLLRAQTKRDVKEYNKKHGTKIPIPKTLEEIEETRKIVSVDVKPIPS